MKWVFWTALVLLTGQEADALKEPELCYVLDGIFFVYSIVVTFLYCRLKIRSRKKPKDPPTAVYEKVEGIYTGLSIREPDPYTTLELREPKAEEHPPEQGQLMK